MTPQNRKFLDDNRLYQEAYSQDMPPRLMGFNDRERFAQVIREEFDPKFSPDLWCGDCVKAMILNGYAMYDNYLKNETRER